MAGGRPALEIKGRDGGSDYEDGIGDEIGARSDVAPPYEVFITRTAGDL